MAIEEVTMPQFGGSVTEGTIRQWIVSVGDRINKYDPLVEVIMSDECFNGTIISLYDGVIKEIIAKEGETLPIGAVICTIEVEGEGQVEEKQTNVKQELLSTKEQINSQSLKNHIGEGECYSTPALEPDKEQEENILSEEDISLSFVLKVLLGNKRFIDKVLSYQVEENELKEEVKRWKEDIHRLRLILYEQDKHMYELKLKFCMLKSYQLIEKSRQRAKLRGTIIFQHAFKTYIELLVQKTKFNYNFLVNEKIFFNIFRKMINGMNISIEERVFLKEYIMLKHKDEIESLVEINIDRLVESVGTLDVDN
ncbi:hypothetical protein HNQ82_002148 [Anoxybacillus tengchongensis]|uniref:Lipoyl-binding domain-containing protein n=1 Tax=Anoxybacillus tengchongensis TaxID=576944 RepID=A0A7W9YSA1_9BACL|nr:hypothetical protein [Anoxybacillus tengchongensis]